MSEVPRLRFSSADLMGRWLARWVAFVLRHRLLVLALGAAAAAGSLTYARNHLGINTDTADMISARLAWRQDFIAYRDAFAIRDRNLLVVVDGSDATSTQQFASQLAARLEGLPELYDSVFLVGGGAFFERNGLLYLPIEELEGLVDRIAAAQPLLGRLTRHLSGAAVVDVARDAAEYGAGDVGTLPVDPFYAELERSLAATTDGKDAPLDWQRLIAPEEAQGARRLLLIQPLLEFERARPAARAIERLRREIGALEQEHAGVEARLTGTVAMEHEELVSVMRGAAAAGIASLVMVIGILYVALRSAVLLVLSVVTLLVGLACTAAFAALAVGHLNLLSVAFAVLYVGLGVDFILHICLRLKELMAGGAAIEPALIETARGVGATLAICAITTAAGFYSFIPTPFEGVSELGLISGTGMFISLFVSATILPALIAIGYRPRAVTARASKLEGRLMSPVLNHPRPVLLATVALGAAAVLSLPAVTFDSNPIHLRDPNTESVATLLDLAEEGAALPLNLVAIAPDHATALQWSSRLRELPQVRDVQSVDTLVPQEQEEKRALLDDLELLLGPDFARTERAASEPGELAAALEALRARLAAGSELGSSAQSLLDAIVALEQRLAQDDDPQRDARLRALDDGLTERLPPALSRLETALGAMPFTRADLPAELAARWVAPKGEELLEIAPRANTNDNAAAARFVAAVREVVPHVTGLPVVNLEASQTVVGAFRLAFVYALVTVLAILLLTGLGVKDSLLVLGPVLLASALTGGMTVWLGLPFNFANIIALPLLLGIGVDNGIHIIHRARSESREGAGMFANSTSRAVLASGVTTIASFGNLAFSAHRGMASMGQLLTLGIVITLAVTLVSLPALLVYLRRP